ncbi:MAG: hypothetical protein BGN86_05500 [Caulobacterales bacterium 68-7]|nr:MAG: hypothetical protein BGN86_05500 [Caulobacterales bacterium 68-7]
MSGAFSAPRLARVSALSLVLLTVVCAGCSPKAVVAPSEAIVAVEPPAPEVRRVVSAEATVLSVDVPKGVLFLRLASSAATVQGLTIGYSASGEAMAGLKAGDRIIFDREVGDGGYVLATRKL